MIQLRVCRLGDTKAGDVISYTADPNRLRNLAEFDHALTVEVRTEKAVDARYANDKVTVISFSPPIVSDRGID